jgi:thioredoxin reductase (NADPH)
MAAETEFFLYSSVNCHLCHDFKQRLDTLLDGYGHRCRVVNIDGDAELTHLYGARLPVLVAGGREICELGFDEAAITRFLKDQD